VLLDELHDLFRIEPPYLNQIPFELLGREVRGIHHADAEDVSHRHGAEANAGALPGLELLPADGGFGGADQGRMRQHHPFGYARGARRVEHQGDVFGSVDLRELRLGIGGEQLFERELRRSGIPRFLAALNDNPFHEVESAHCVAHFRQIPGIGHHHSRARVFDHESELALGEHEHDRYGGSARAEDALKDVVHRRMVDHAEHGDAAPLDAQLRKRALQALGVLDVLRGRDFLAFEIEHDALAEPLQRFLRKDRKIRRLNHVASGASYPRIRVAGNGRASIAAERHPVACVRTHDALREGVAERHDFSRGPATIGAASHVHDSCRRDQKLRAESDLPTSLVRART
jgi:hypothetical protein